MCCIICCIVVFTGCRKTEFNTVPSISAFHSNASLKPLGSSPNIILILGDDVGYEIPTVDGGQSYETPNIDMLAAEGMRFTQCRGTPLCSPSRFELLTGKYNFRNYNLWGIMDTTNRTIANMLSNAGYKTLVAGKWQLSGGDTAIHSLGFQDYMVWNPFTGEGNEDPGNGSRYKDPVIYQAGHIIPADSTKGKYGDDIFTDYIKNFIDSNTANPFFVYYALCLVHPPFVPTPIDSEFATWNAKARISDIRYYPSMVKYMDMKIGEIIDKVTEDSIADNTIILFVGDNGTSQQITSIFNGSNFTGGKGTDQEAGIHVPLIAYCPGKISPGIINNDLIDFSDLMPTLAEAAGIPLPTDYGVLDGVSFYPQLSGLPGNPRSWTYCYFYPNPIKRPNRHDSWIQNNTYKLYDSLSSKRAGKYYDFINDPAEVFPLKNNQLTADEQQTKSNFRVVLSTMHN